MQTISSSPFQTLPLFRKDLKVYRGPNGQDGSPTYSLFDPVKNQYYLISWKESLILKALQPGMTAEGLAEAISHASSVHFTPQEITGFFLQAYYLELLRLPKDSDYYMHLKEKGKVGLGFWLLMHYLYLRIPLLNPDRFLARTLPYVEFLGSKAAWICYGIISFLGLFLILNRFDEFLHTFTYFFNFEGVFLYAVAISLVKVIHEFSHAYVAKHYRLHVPTMGIAFIVLWPVLYTDVTDGWKLSKRSQRLTISLAGVVSETIIAGLSTLGWALSDPGVMQSIFFVLASSSWISSIVININPAVRFDGYYILCDLWGVDNLQPRAFAVTRWKYQEWLFGIKQPPPEEGLTSERITGFVIYSLFAWTYRLLLYIAVALFVYYEFTKALGIILFSAEILIFFVWPVVYEFQQLYKVRSLMTINIRSVSTVLISSLLFLWFVLPLPHEESFQAVIAPKKVQVIYSPLGGVVDFLNGYKGKQVQKGERLAQVESLALLQEKAEVIYNRELLEKQVLLLNVNPKESARLAEKQAELGEVEARLEEIKKQESHLTLKAEMSGKIYDWNELLKQDQTIPDGTIFGKISDSSTLYAIGYISETLVNTIKIGEEAKVIVLHPYAILKGTVESLEPIRAENLEHPSLASIYFGPLPVTEIPRDQRLALVESYYILYVRLEKEATDDLHYGSQAEIKLRGPWRSYLIDLYQYVRRIILRESSL